MRGGAMKALRGKAIPLLFLLLLLLPACRAERGGERLPLRVGYMICNSEEETRARFEPLTRYLARALARPVVPVYLDTIDFADAYERGELDLTHTNSLLYVIMREKGLLPLAGEKRGEQGFRSAGAVMVRKDSPLRTLADLKGKRMVFGPMLAPTAFLSQYDLLQRAGVDPEKDLELYTIPAGSWKHEKVLYGVWMGAYDAAAVPMLDYERMVSDKKIGPDDLRALATAEPVPYCVFGASPALDPSLRGEVASLLLNLTPSATAEVEGEELRVLKAAEVDGFVPLDDSDFEPVRAMAQRTRMPPYQGRW
jgi:phosphonate transport system substrate-binding protein